MTSALWSGMRHWILAVVLLLPCLAIAEKPEVTMRRHYETGTRLFSVGEFERAALEYRAAYELRPHPALLYNIAQAYRNAKNSERAIFFYRSYLRNAPAASNRAEVEGFIAKLEASPPPPPPIVPPPAAVSPPAVAKTELPAAQPSITPPSIQATAVTPKPRSKRWTILAAVGGVVVVGVGLGVGLGLGLRPREASPPSTALGNWEVF